MENKTENKTTEEMLKRIEGIETSVAAIAGFLGIIGIDMIYDSDKRINEAEKETDHPKKLLHEISRREALNNSINLLTDTVSDFCEGKQDGQDDTEKVKNKAESGETVRLTTEEIKEIMSEIFGVGK